MSSLRGIKIHGRNSELQGSKILINRDILSENLDFVMAVWKQITQDLVKMSLGKSIFLTKKKNFFVL